MSHYLRNSVTKMRIRRHISFRLRSYGSVRISYQIQLIATYNSYRLVFSTGCQINSAEAWDSSSGRVIEGYTGHRGETALTINKELRERKEDLEWVFQYFEVNSIQPSPKQVSEKYKERVEGIKPQKEPAESKTVKTHSTKVLAAFDAFVAECGEKNAWTAATYGKMASLKEDLTVFKKDLNLSDLNETGLTAFVRYLRDEKVLKKPRKKKGERKEYDREDTIGLKNSTIRKKLDFLGWFLNWAFDHGYKVDMAYKSFRPTLKTTQKKVIYLTKGELEQLKALQIPKELAHLECVRDVFLFCCFSGLRHSDAYNLRRSDIKGDHMDVTTVKTADSISIELNQMTRAILEKYKDFSFTGNKALPVITNQAMNRELKDLCRLAGINEEVRITTYKGNQRRDEVKEKWQLIGTHTGRRTFIVNCLSLGIPPNVVMKWTGHSDYNAMKPYIDIVDSIKASEMTKLDSLI